MLHCILDENDQLGIVNTTWKLMTKGQCPYYNRHTEQIGAFACNDGDGKCPEKETRSYQATQCCLKDNRQSTNFSKTSTDVVCSCPDQPVSGPLAIAVLLLVILCISGVIGAGWVFRRQELRIKKLREKRQLLEAEKAALLKQIQSAEARENAVEIQATENRTFGETTRLFLSNEYSFGRSRISSPPSVKSLFL